MKVSLTLEGIDRLIKQLDVPPKKAKQIVNRAVASTTIRLRKDIVDDVHKAYDIPKRAAKISKVRTRRRIRKGRGTIWVGRNAIKSAYLGKFRNSGSGAFSGSHFFEGGFVATMESGHKGIFKRVSTGIEEQEIDLDVTPIMLEQRVKTAESDIMIEIEGNLISEVQWLTF